MPPILTSENRRIRAVAGERSINDMGESLSLLQLAWGDDRRPGRQIYA
jgi:hypothetical protein